MIRTPTLLLLLASCGEAHAATIPPDRLIAAAQGSLRAMSSDLPGELIFNASMPVGSQVGASAEAVSLSVGPVAGDWPRKRVGVPVHISVDGVLQHSRMVWFTVQWWLERPTYARAFPGGAASAHVVTIDKRIDAAGVLTVTEATSPISLPAGLRLRRSVHAGEVMRANDFSDAPMIARRDPVTLRVRRGAIELRLPAIAATDGQLGDAITVVPQGARAAVHAHVDARGEVSIEQ
ncbi:flagella basal body P-ring formation protein FlgA [Xanthomonas cucurbitae]|uniref:Flagella basal body P-ring formation protein FlgA n=1 Tax=Xanthomonas cucurbitae TaxID=56453 RepID=A0ABY7YCU6_9XANT|nr:flagella basal body P-ring formation protein FlgA [Xanthomonas cucurbitae]WDM67821.1 flagella basal body P-ring formation protein FlgA [Xanthomonas cucurbitae]WDM71695.1 flagella basal body P-ring formation protein FlgA [Xanthomonas cucurbitae]